MRGIIYISETESKSLCDRLWLAIKDIVPKAKKGTKGTKRYTMPIKHIAEDKWFAGIKESGYYWDKVQSKLTEQELSNIEDITPDWFE